MSQGYRNPGINRWKTIFILTTQAPYVLMAPDISALGQ